MSNFHSSITDQNFVARALTTSSCKGSMTVSLLPVATKLPKSRALLVYGQGCVGRNQQIDLFLRLCADPPRSQAGETQSLPRSSA